MKNKNPMKKLKILFLCTGNSCRSQMAEAFAKHYHKDKYEFYSAGTQIHGMNQNAIKVMGEIGIDISTQYSKTIEEFTKMDFDVVFTVCDNAQKSCPSTKVSAKNIIHVGFDDPPVLVKNQTPDQEELLPYRKVRDQIKQFIINIENYYDQKQ
jgi:arsenate reductase (thioredoxin)